MNRMKQRAGLELAVICLTSGACFARLLLESAGFFPIRNYAVSEFGLEQHWQSQHSTTQSYGYAVAQ